jgi:hypothetical protein
MNWIYVNRNNSAKRSAGYFIIGYGPEIKSPSEMNMMFGMNGVKVDSGVRYDYPNWQTAENVGWKIATRCLGQAVIPYH